MRGLLLLLLRTFYQSTTSLRPPHGKNHIGIISRLHSSSSSDSSGSILKRAMLPPLKTESSSSSQGNTLQDPLKKFVKQNYSTEKWYAGIRISDVVEKYVDLKKRPGSTVYQCLCPFHEDRNPSMYVSNEKGIFNCYACGTVGTVWEFVKLMDGSSYMEAKEKIQKLLNIAGGNSGGTRNSSSYPQEQSPYNLKVTRLREMLALSNDFFAFQLLHNEDGGKQALAYILSRKLSIETMTAFRLGYNPRGAAGLPYHLRKLNYTNEDITAAGLAIINTYGNLQTQGRTAKSAYDPHSVFDLLGSRLIIPIRSPQGDVIGFAGRLIEQRPTQASPSASKPVKYRNTADTLLFKKKEVLFGMDLARSAIVKEGTVVIVEGYFDVMTLYELGIRNSVAVMGTSFTQEHLDNLLSLKIRADSLIAALSNSTSAAGGTAAAQGHGLSIVFMLDEDAAGVEATRRFIYKFLMGADRDVDVKIASFRSLIAPEYSSSHRKENAADSVGDRPSLLLRDAAHAKDVSDLCSKFEDKKTCADIIEKIIARAKGWKQWMIDGMIRTAAVKALNTTSPIASLNPEKQTEKDAFDEYDTMTALDSLRDNVTLNSSLLSQIVLFLQSMPKGSRTETALLVDYCSRVLSEGRESIRNRLEIDLLARLQLPREGNQPANIQDYPGDLVSSVDSDALTAKTEDRQAAGVLNISSATQQQHQQKSSVNTASSPSNARFSRLRRNQSNSTSSVMSQIARQQSIAPHTNNTAPLANNRKVWTSRSSTNKIATTTSPSTHISRAAYSDDNMAPGERSLRVVQNRSTASTIYTSGASNNMSSNSSVVQRATVAGLEARLLSRTPKNPRHQPAASSGRFTASTDAAAVAVQEQEAQPALLPHAAAVAVQEQEAQPALSPLIEAREAMATSTAIEKSSDRIDSEVEDNNVEGYIVDGGDQIGDDEKVRRNSKNANIIESRSAREEVSNIDRGNSYWRKGQMASMLVLPTHTAAATAEQEVGEDVTAVKASIRE